MRYYLEEIEDQLLDALKASSALDGVNVRTHVGEVSIQTFMNPELQEGFIHSLPFVLVQYQGKRLATADATYRENWFELFWRFYVGAKSLRNKREAQKTAYAMLRSVYDALHGRWPCSTSFTISTQMSRLTGYTIEDVINSTPIVIKKTNHGKLTGDKVYIQNVLGLTVVNNTALNPYWTITKLTDDTFSLDGSAGDADWANGGDFISAITTELPSTIGAFIVGAGKDEEIRINFPEIVVYHTDYSIKLLA